MREGDTGIPSGVVTFLFTDVEGSTMLWAADQMAMSASLEVHDRILREAVESFGGYVFTTAGDSFAVAFDRATDAVTAGLAAQATLAAVPWPRVSGWTRSPPRHSRPPRRGGALQSPTVPSGPKS